MSTAKAAPWAWMLAAVIVMTAAASHALSLRSTRAEASLGDVRPGSRVSYARALGAPFGVVNTGTEPATVELAFESPPPARLLEGYEPFPDPGWAKAALISHTLAPGQKGETDITVTVPQGRALEGRQFQLEVGLKGRAPGGAMLQLRTRLLLAVGDGDPEGCPPLSPDRPFELTPGEARLDAVPLGRHAPLRGPRFTGFKLANGGEKEAFVSATALRVWPEDMVPPSGYAPAPNPRWLRTGPPAKVPAGTVRTLELTLDVPKEPRYRGKKWAFLVAVDVESEGRKGRRWAVLAVSTEPEEPARSAGRRGEGAE